MVFMCFIVYFLCIFVYFLLFLQCVFICVSSSTNFIINKREERLYVQQATAVSLVKYHIIETFMLEL